MSGDLVFSDKAASDMSSALGKAAGSIVSLSPADPSGYELGDTNVISAASDLFIGLNAFAQGLSVGIAHCESTVGATKDTIAIFDQQLEAAAPQMATFGRTNPVKRSEAEPGPLPTRTTVKVTNMDLSSIGGRSKSKSTWKGKAETKHETKSNAITGESSTTASRKHSDGREVSVTHSSDHNDGSSTHATSYKAKDGSSTKTTTDVNGDGESHTTRERTAPTQHADSEGEH